MGHLAAIKREAISTSAYAKRHGLAVESLYYWQSKLKISAPETPVGRNKAKTFVALRVVNPVEIQHPTACTLVLTSGMRLEISTLPAPEWLGALGRAIQGMR